MLSEYEEEQALKKDVWLYLSSVVKEWHTWIGVFFGLGIVAFLLYIGKLPESLAPWILASGYVVAQFNAWRKEKRLRLEIERKAEQDVQAAQQRVLQTERQLKAAEQDLDSAIASVKSKIKEVQDAADSRLKEALEDAKKKLKTEQEKSAGAVRGVSKKARHRIAALEVELQIVQSKIASEADALYNRIRDGYLEYPQSEDHKLWRLIKLGAAKLPSTRVLLKLCQDIQNKTGSDPFHDCEAILEEHRLEALHWIRDQQASLKTEADVHDFIMSFCAHLGTL